MIIIEELSQLQQVRRDNPDAEICYEQDDGTKQIFLPGHDARPMTIGEDCYTPRYTS